MIQDVLVLDTETNGLNPEEDEVIEVACALYNVPNGSVVTTYSAVLHGLRPNAAEHINQIPSSLLPFAIDPDYAWKRVNGLAQMSDAILAHNAEFDKAFVPNRWDIPWICTMGDVVWPKRSGPRDALVKLLLAHGLGISHAHRAMADVDMICRLLTRTAEMGFDLQVLLTHALRPKAKYISLEPYAMKDEVKKAGFGWDGKVWSRVMAIEDAEKLDFRVKVEE